MTTLLEVKFGSQVYGTALPTSDIDVGRVLLEPKEFIFGIQKTPTISQKIVGDLDVREMYLQRFVSLCAAGNPNTLEWLYTPDKDISTIDRFFKQHIWLNRTSLLSRDKLIASHLGFAKSQIIKMQKHESAMGAKRKALYAKYGYDVKYASHAVRLMYQLSDILTFGEIILPYFPGQQKVLREIKAGEWCLEAFMSFYNRLEEGIGQDIEVMADNIPEKTNTKRIAQMLEPIYMAHYYPTTQFSVLDY